jgi:uncharacterized protein (UPF0212 family)
VPVPPLALPVVLSTDWQVEDVAKVEIAVEVALLEAMS